MDENKLKNYGEEIAKHIGSAMFGKLADSSRNATKTFNGFYERLRYQREFDLISEEEYYNRLEQLRDRYFAKGTDNWVKYTKTLYKYQEKLLEAEKKEYRNLYDDIADYATEKLEEILKKQQKLAKNLNSYGSLYNVNTVKMNGFTDHYYSLHDLSSDILAIERYSKDMDRIRQRSEMLGIDKDASAYLLDRIKEMKTEDALQFMSALLYANDDTFANYTGKAFEKYNLSQSVSSHLYEEKFKNGISESFTYMKDKLSEMGLEIPEEFAVSGSISAEKFGEAFILELDNQMEIIRGAIDEFTRGFGASLTVSGDTYNTTNMSYNINSSGGEDIVEQIRRYETVKRLSGISQGVF